MESKKYIAYYRVSTQKQGKYGLGLEAQRAMVKNTIGAERIEKEFIEVESGRKKERLELMQALIYCKEKGATLIVAKLDRLARSAYFIFSLKESGVDFVCCDLLDLNPFTLGVFASLAQYEADLISQRTRAALKAKKDQGFKLGSPQNLTVEARKKGYKERGEKARSKETNLKAIELAKDLRAQNLSYDKIAERLNRYGFKSSRGGKFYASSVRNLFSLYSH